MAKRKDVPTRHEVREQIESKKKGMDEKEINLDQLASDVETMIETLKKLDLGGTLEGSEQVERAIESAENVTTREFDKEDSNLDQIQTDAEKYEEELKDRRESSESDMGKISDASNKINTRETINELKRAKETALLDIEYLAEQIDIALSARKKSESIQEKLQARIHSGKRR